MDAEAIRNPINAFLPVQYTMREMMHCDHKKGFSSSNVAIQKRSWSKRDEPPQTTSKAELHQRKDYAACLVGLERCGIF